MTFLATKLTTLLLLVMISIDTIDVSTGTSVIVSLLMYKPLGVEFYNE